MIACWFSTQYNGHFGVFCENVNGSRYVSLLADLWTVVFSGDWYFEVFMKGEQYKFTLRVCPHVV